MTYHSPVRGVAHSYPALGVAFHHEVKEQWVFISPDTKEVRASCSVTARWKRSGQTPSSIKGLGGGGGGEVVTTLVRTCRAISSVDDFGDTNVHKFIPWYLHIDAPLLNTTEIIKTLCG